MDENSSNKFRIIIDGVQTVRNIQSTYDRLSAAIAEHQAIVVDCDAVTELDLSLIQLLLSAKATADSNGKSLALATPAGGKLRTALERAGFLADAPNGSDPAAFWLKGRQAA